MKTTNYKRFEDLEDKYFGEKGTPERDDYEFDLKMELIGEKIIPILIEAVKAEQSLINDQRAEINKSKEKISKQNSDIIELQQIVLNQQQSITRLQEENALIKAQCCAGLLEEPQSGQELKSATGPISQSTDPKSKEIDYLV